MFLAMKKKRTVELLDQPGLSLQDVRANLADIRRINSFLGGTRVVRRFFEQQLRRTPLRAATWLDVATGSADIPMTLTSWSQRIGMHLRITLTDLKPAHFRAFENGSSGSAGFPGVAADVRRLPFADASFTWVTASLVLHQFDDDDSVTILRELARVASRAFLVNDLVRDWVPYLFIRLTGPVFLRSPISRHDGPASVRQGFRRSELAALASRAGLENFSVSRCFPYRLSLVAEKGDSLAL